MKSDLVSRSWLKTQLTVLGMNGAKSHVRAYARCVNAVEIAPDVQLWRDAAKEQPADTDTAVLVVVSGRYGNIEFHDAVQLGWYWGEKEGWCIEGYEKWENPHVSYWMEIPDAPEGVQIDG